MGISRLIGAAAIVTALAGFSPTTASAQNIEWTSGSVGGSWFTVTAGLAGIAMEEVDGLNIRIVPGGGKDNPSKIAAGISQLGMGIDFLASAALKGEEPYTKPAPNLTTLGQTWMTSQFHLIVDAEETRGADEIFSDPEITVGTSSPATSEALTLGRILEHYNNGPDVVKDAGGTVMYASYSQLVAAFQNGQVDVVLAAGPAPTGVALEIEAGRRKAKLIPFSDELRAHLTDTYGYGSFPIPAGAYKVLQTEGGDEVMVNALATIVLADAALPEETVYKMMVAILNNQDKFANFSGALKDFNGDIAWKDLPIPLHPGAEKAYRELGYMK